MTLPTERGPGDSRLRLIRGRMPTVALRVALVTIVLSAILAHILENGASPGAVGIIAVLGHLFAVVAAGGLLAFATATGRAILRSMPSVGEGACGELVLATALGLGATSAAVLGIAVVLGPSAWALWGGLAILAVATRRELAALPHLVGAAFKEALTAYPPGLARRIGMALVVAMGLVCLCLALLPPTGYDALAYHLQVPRQWLANGTVFLPEDNYHTAFIGVNQLLYLPLLAAGVPSATQVLNVMQALLLGLGVFALGKRVGGPAVGSLSALILFGSPIVLIASVLPMVDVPLTLILVAATLAMVEALDAPADHRWLLLAGTLLGVGFGVKYLALAYAAALAPIGIVALHWAASGSPGRAAGLAASVGLCFLLAASPWIAKNTLMFGNPVFPYLSAPRVEPWLRPLYPALRPVGVDTALFSVHNEMRKAVTPTRLFLHPEQLEADVDRHDSAPYLPLVLVPLALLLPERRRIAPVLLPALGYVALLLAYSPYTSIRYLMPMLPGLSIALAVLCVAMARRLSRLTRAVAGVTMLVLALPVPLALITRAQWKQAIPHVMGLVSDRAVLDGYWDTSDYMDVVRWTDSHAPAGAPVILLFEGRGFYFRSTVYEDILLRNWAYLSQFANDGSCLAATGARFMILNDDGRRYFLSRGVKPEALQWDKFQAFRERCLDLRYQNAKFEVFALKPTG